MIKKIIFIYACVISIPLSAQIEKDLDDVFVEGKISQPFHQTNQSIEIITKEQIQNFPASSVEELLSYYSGIDIRQRGVHGVQADISIRGSSYEQVLVLVNGIRMNDSQTGHNTMNLPFDLSSVEKIEIIKGPAARRFGQNAYAGAINIVTNTSEVNNIQTSLYGGEFGTYGLEAAVNYKTGKDYHFLQSGISHSDGYRFNTDYNVYNLWYQNHYKLNNGTIKLQGGIIQKKFGANGFYSTPAAINQYEEVMTSILSVGITQKFDKLWYNANIYWRRAQDEYLFVRNNPGYYRNLHMGNNAGAEANFNYNSSLGTTGIGVDTRLEYLSSNNLGNRQRTVFSVFFDHQFSLLNKKLSITPGFTWANYTDFKYFWYPGVDLGYSFNEIHKIYANIGKTYRVPSYTDLYYADAVNEGNPNLKPEDAITYELGYRFTRSNILANAGIFRRESDNLIDWTKQNEADKWKPINIAKVKTLGIEANFEQKFNTKFLNSYQISYTYLDNELKQNEKFSRYSLDNLRHQLSVKVNYTIAKNISQQIIYRYNDRVNLDDYHLLDSKISWNPKNISLFLQVNNILNTSYTETNLVPMPGRWLQGGISWKNLL